MKELPIQVYVIDVDIAFLCGKKTMEQLGSKLDTVKSILETDVNVNLRNFEMITTSTGHYDIRLEKHKRKDNEIIYLEEKREELLDCRAIKNGREANNHRSAD